MSIANNTPEYHFTIFAPNSANKLFQLLDERLMPRVFLIIFDKIGKIKITPPQYEHYCSKEIDILSETLNLNNINEEEFNFYYNKINDSKEKNDPNTILFLKSQLLFKQKEKQISDYINSISINEGYFSFCSKIFFAENQIYIIVVQLQTLIINEYYSLTKDILYSIISDLPKSLFQSVVNHYINKFILLLKNNDFINNVDLIRSENIHEILHLAGSSLIGSISCTINNAFFDLFEKINEISSLKYEKIVCNGKLILSQPTNKSIIYEITFKDPIPLDNIRRIRKLMEITSEKLHLICDAQNSYGLGYVNYNNYTGEDENVFEIIITGFNHWSLIHNNNGLMDVENGIARLSKPKINKITFYNEYNKTFNNISSSKIDELFEIIKIAFEQKKGTMILITENAEEESIRLKNQCINVTPFKINNKYLFEMTKIDGAIIINNALQCYAFGAILDGVASSHGDSSRGARYNSALTYKNSKTNKCFLIVISEDNTIDFIHN